MDRGAHRELRERTGGGMKKAEGHTAKVAAEAVRLREAGWTIPQIRDVLAARGIDPPPCRTTIMRWTTPGFAERRQAKATVRKRELYEPSYRPAGRKSAVWRAGRMRALFEAGLSPNAVAKVMTFDFPEHPVSGHQVRYALQRDREKPGTRTLDDGVAA